MAPNKLSPNWFWSRLGFSVVCEKKNNGLHGSREIKDQYDRRVCKNAGHLMECQLASFLLNVNYE